MDKSFQLQRLTLLKSLGFSPRTILDIGAYKGEWTKMAKIVYPTSKIFMVEATPDHMKELENVTESAGFEMALLGERAKKNVKFYIADPNKTLNTTGNSAFLERTIYFNPNHALNLPMITLDSLVEKRKLKNIDLIKLDTQGSELNILKGAKKTISTVTAILLEVQNIEYNQGAPFIEDVIVALKGYGFRMFDVFEIHWLPTGELFQLDILFIKKTSKLFKKGTLS